MSRVAASCLIALLTISPTGASHGAALTDLNWLAGHWAAADGAYEEVWLAPREGSMVGSFRWVFGAVGAEGGAQGEGRQVLEFLIIQDTPDGILLRFKHFDPDYEPWEKQAPNTYRAEELTSDSVTFDRVAGSDRAPRNIRYTRRGDRLTFIAMGSEAEDGNPLVLEFLRR